MIEQINSNPNLHDSKTAESLKNMLAKSQERLGNVSDHLHKLYEKMPKMLFLENEPYEITNSKTIASKNNTLTKLSNIAKKYQKDL